MAESRERPGPGTRRGRLAGLIVFAVLVVGFTAVCSVQIIVQAFAQGSGPAPPSCRDGIRGLIAAVYRARTGAMAATGGEREALATFRRLLEPEWSARGGLDAVCSADPAGRDALEALDRLRYAEEHALRYEAMDIARLRRRVAAVAGELGLPR